MRRIERPAGLKMLALAAVLTAAAPLLPATDPPGPQDIVTQARGLATSGHRAEALGMLKDRLAKSPQDSDARVLYGVVLSWEGRYDESRAQLEQVLAGNPTHGDALPALINVELWSDHPARAEALVERALERSPDDPTLLITKARAFRALGRNQEAIHTLNHLLMIDPKNKQARGMRKSMVEKGEKWEVSTDHFYDRFRGGPSPQHEQWVSLKREFGRVSATGRFERAYRFGLVSQQFELDLYPSIRPGTYAYLNFGYSPDNVLYPRNRFGADIFQMLGHGFEASGGFRRLNFSSKVNIYVAAFSKYQGNWYLTGRAYLTPDNLGVSRTVVLSARRFFGEGGLFDYFDIRFSKGASLEQIHTTLETQVLDSTGFSSEYNKTIGPHWAFALKGGWSREDRLNLNDIQRFIARFTLYYRF